MQEKWKLLWALFPVCELPNIHGNNEEWDEINELEVDGHVDNESKDYVEESEGEDIEKEENKE